jgi:hypothetical protein
MATGKYFVLVDPCIYFTKDMFEKMYEVNESNENCYTHNHELRGKNPNNASVLTKNYYELSDLMKLIDKDNTK